MDWQDFLNFHFCCALYNFLMTRSPPTKNKRQLPRWVCHETIILTQFIIYHHSILESNPLTTNCQASPANGFRLQIYSILRLFNSLFLYKCWLMNQNLSKIHLTTTSVWSGFEEDFLYFCRMTDMKSSWCSS